MGWTWAALGGGYGRNDGVMHTARSRMRSAPPSPPASPGGRSRMTSWSRRSALTMGVTREVWDASGDDAAAE